MTLNSLLPRIQGLRRKHKNQLFRHRSHFLSAMTGSWGKGFEGTVWAHRRGTNLSGLEKNLRNSGEPSSEDSPVRLEPVAEKVLGSSVFVPVVLRLGRGHDLRLHLEPVQRAGKHLHCHTDWGDTGLFTHFLESSILMLCLHWWE